MRRLIMAAVTLFIFTSVAAAQSLGPAALELRGGASFPTADFGEAGLKTGGGFEANGSFAFMPHLKAYGGWGWNLLKMEGTFAGGQYDVGSTGYVFGLQFQHPVIERVGGFVRAGGLYKHVELEDRNGNLVADSGHELGWEAGGGLVIPLTDRFALTPGVRYRTFSADLSVGTQNVPVDLSYVALDMGLAVSFGPRPFLAALAR